MLFFRADDYECTVCLQKFTRRDNMRRHMLKKHEIIYKDNKSHEAHLMCHMPGCSETFFQKTLFVDHLAQEHGVNFDIEEQTFQTESDFLAWKEQEELQNHVYFSQQSGQTITNKYVCKYFYCQHDGHDNPHRKKIEPPRKTIRRNKKGTVKKGNFCPAKMTVKVDKKNGSTNVCYLKSHNHSVHVSNIIFQPLPPSIKREIVTKVSIGMTDN